MVDLVRLTANERPPADDAWLWISRDTSGHYRCTGSPSLKKELGTAFEDPSTADEVDLNVTVERAREWAGARNVATIYLSE